MFEVHFIGNEAFWDWFIGEAEKARDGGVGFLTADPGSSWNTGSIFVSFRRGHHREIEADGPSERTLFGMSIGDPNQFPGSPFQDFVADEDESRPLFVPKELE